MHNKEILELMLKLSSRLYHDMISALSSVHICLQSKQYDLAFQSVNTSLEKAVQKRDIITNKTESYKEFALNIIKNEYEDCKIEVLSENSIQISYKYFDEENIFIKLSLMMLKNEFVKISIKNK